MGTAPPSPAQLPEETISAFYISEATVCEAAAGGVAPALGRLKAQAVTHTQTSPPSSELCLPAELSQPAAARTFARQAAAAYGLDGDGCYEFAYAVNEAVTNAIRHGLPDERGFIRVTFTAEADRLTGAVRDWGTFTPPATALARAPMRRPSTDADLC